VRKRRKHNRILRFFKRLFLFLFVIIILVLSVVVGAGWAKYDKVTSEFSVDEAIEKIRTQENFTDIDDMSLTFVNAMVSIEDRRFYKHDGYDIIGIIRAVTTNIKDKELSEGGSSITQQLAKNIYFMNDNTLSRKIAEIFIAVDLEKKLSKKDILELYFNVIYYGSGYYNIYDASMGYFNKPPSELTDYEATILAGIPNAPSVYSLNNNPDLAKQRQRKVVESMLDMKYLTKEEAESILSQQ